MQFDKEANKISTWFLKEKLFTTSDRDRHFFQIPHHQYQPSGAGGTHSPPATPHCLQNPKWPPGGPKKANGVWKVVYP